MKQSTNFRLAYALACLLTCLLIGFALPAKAQNNALNFDGAGDYVSIPHNAALKPATHVTVEAWVFVSNITTNAFYEIARKEDGNDRILFAFQNNGAFLSFGLGVGGSYSELDVAITASDYVNRWVHVAAVYNGTQKIIYRNGVVIGTQTVSGAIGTTGTAPLLLGSETGAVSFFNGTMDEFRFWNVPRTQAQIQSGMTGSLAGTESGLVVYYNFNEGVANANNTALTTVNDLATTLGGTNTGTLNGFTRNGTTSNWVGGNANNALNFDHTGFPNRDFVSIPHNANLDISTQLTLSAWIRPNGLNAGGFDNILLKGNYGYGFAVDFSNQLGYWSDSGYGSCPRFGTITDNVWTHVAVVVVQGVSTTFYINGVQVGQSTTAGHTTINSGGASAVTTIGRQGDFDGNYFAGDMDEVMVWNTALNVTQVNTAMNMGFLGNESGLVAYYKFNQGVANATNTGVTTLTDLAGGDNNGTLTNFTLSAGTVSNWVNGAIIAPEINVQGNATNITDGDASPTSADHTDFGVTIISTPLVRTFTIQNQGTRTLNISSINNTNTTDYTVGTAPTSIAVGSSATFTVTLNSATLGTKTATITINSDDPDEAAYDFAITGRVINATPSNFRGNMMSFDGVNDYVDATNNGVAKATAASLGLSTTALTVEVWCKLNTLKDYGNIVGFMQDNGASEAGWAIGTRPTGVYFALSNAILSGSLIYTTYAVSTGSWVHLAMTYDGTTQNNYINGVLVNTRTEAGGIQYLDSWLGIGYYKDDNETYFSDGNIDEVRLWNVARTQAQIRENMHLTFSGAETGLVAYYQFNETSGNAIDAVAGNNGTLNGGATRAASTVSVGKGVSKTVSVSSLSFSSEVDLTTTNMEIDFDFFASSPIPNGDLVISQITGETPHLNTTVPNATTSCYWVVRNFGSTNAGFVFSSMRFQIPSSNRILTADETTPTNLKLYRRSINGGATWAQVADANSASNTTKQINFDTPSNTSFSEFIIGSTSGALPITLLGLKGERVEGLRGERTEEVKLDWSTASEINNKGFEVEMSDNGLAYKKIAFIEGKGNSTTVMSYELRVHNADEAYYRLKQVDFDGSFSYSPVVFVEGLVGKVVVYPNPNNGKFAISVGKDKLDSPTRLLNAVGKEVWRGVQTEVRTTGLPTGVYFLHTTVAGKTKITKVVIER